MAMQHNPFLTKFVPLAKHHDRTYKKWCSVIEHNKDKIR
ncbi:uncharacterized protein G2W53_005782 [Senna tora]|uniref:Uncharacterized protein n=1 Tax=Senna tora TaxID=362788 RepID=A0A835CE56_9FABA|nr:uncharacterized protein G2W53_005782 [Senna tora]